MYRTLVADDDFLVRSYLKTLDSWEKAGYEIVDDAEDGEEAYGFLQKEKIDVLVTDLTMPVMDGLSMIYEIKQDTTLSNIPVMILSAKASVENQQRGFDEGVDAYITKPFSTPYLLGRIEAILTQRRNI